MTIQKLYKEMNIFGHVVVRAKIFDGISYFGGGSFDYIYRRFPDFEVLSISSQDDVVILWVDPLGGRT